MFDENKHTHPQNNDEGPRHRRLRLSRRSLRCRPADSGSRCTPASPPPLTTNFRKEEWSCWYCRPS